MKKTIILLGMLSIGVAHAQQTQVPAGRVGINTSRPEATFVVDPVGQNSTSGNTNEGIIAPRLDKIRVASIATPVEGTFVYVKDDPDKNPINSYTGNVEAVSKIDEKGYYYFDGTYWVKAKGGNATATGGLWVEERPNNVVLQSNIVADRVIKYDNEGKYQNVPRGAFRINTWDDDGNGSVSVVHHLLNEHSASSSGNLHLMFSNKFTIPNSIIDNPQHRYLGYNFLIINDDTQPGEGQSYGYFGQMNRVQANMLLQKTVHEMVGAKNFVESFTNQAKIHNLIGSKNVAEQYTTLQPDNKITNLIGSHNLAKINADDSVINVVGAINEVTTHRNDRNSPRAIANGNITKMSASENIVKPNSTGNIMQIAVSDNSLDMGESLSDTNVQNAFITKSFAKVSTAFSGVIKDLVGKKIHFDLPLNHKKVENLYGIRIEDVNGGSHLNYAIHTKAGDIRFGSLANKAPHNHHAYVVVDRDGVLKVANHDYYNGIRRPAKASDACTADNAGATQYKEVFRKGKKVGVMGFCMRKDNGTFGWAYLSANSFLNTEDFVELDK